MNDLILRSDDLVNNPTTRVPVCLCLDISGSMAGEPIRELNEGIRMFYDSVRNDETAMYSAEICIVTFGGNGARKECDFASLEIQPDAPCLYPDGGTPMGEGVNLALDLLEERKQEYRDAGVDYFQPWLVLMTDGCPNGSPAELERSINRVNGMIRDRKLAIFPIGIGAGADMRTLNLYSPQKPALKLQGLKFNEFFSWLSKSVSRTSQSIPGENVKLDVQGIESWGSIY